MNRICLAMFLAAARASSAAPAIEAPVFFEPAGIAWIAHAGDREFLLDAGAGLLSPGGARVHFSRAHPARAEGLARLAGRVNRFPGRDPRHWRTAIPTFARVRFPSLYPGIDLVYHGRAGDLELDFVVAPHANPNAIALAFSAASPALAPGGEIGAGAIHLRRPRVFQRTARGPREISAAWSLAGRRARFRLGPYDRSRPLLIDPIVELSTYFGGAANAEPHSIAADAAGNLYLTGAVRSPGFPVLNPLQTTGAIYVSKLNPTGSALIYSTYLGGSSPADVARSIAVDPQGNAYLTGSTASADFPVVNAFQPALAAPGPGARDAFVLKLNPSGSQILYGSFLGGSSADDGVAIALDPAGAAYVAGRTESLDFPTTPAVVSQNLTGAVNSFVAKIAPDGSGLAYSTYLGGSAFDVALALAVDPAGNALAVVYSSSTDFPGLNATAALTTPVTLVARLNATASAVTYATSLGENNIAQALAADAAGNAWIAGDSTTIHLPVTSGALAGAPGGEAYFRSADGGNTFAAGGIAASAVNSLATAAADSATIYAGTSDGVFQSSDNGQTWTAFNNGLTSLAVNAVAVDPQTNSTLYAGTDRGPPLFKSLDSGFSWNPIGDLPGDLGINCLAIDPNSPSVIYAGGQGVIKSVDGGDGWRPAAALPAPVLSLAVDPANSGIIYAGTDVITPPAGGIGGIYRSTDGGQTFAPATVAGEAIAAILPDPNTPGTVYAAGSRALYASADSGQTWSPLAAAPAGSAGFGALAFDPAQPSVLFACLRDGRVWSAGALFGDAQAAAVTSCVFSAGSVLHIGAARGSDAFLVELDPTGAVRYATYLGGRLDDHAAGVAVDASGDVFVAGATQSPDFPLAKPVQSQLAGAVNAFLAEFDPTGALLFSTFFGGSGADSIAALAVAPDGAAFLTGTTTSPDFPLVNPLEQSARAPRQFVVAIKP